MMDLYAVIDQVVALLQTHGRLTYRALKLQFQLEDEHVAALKEELIDARELAVDREGKMLVWRGAAVTASAASKAGALPQLSPVQKPLTPASYTPLHLAQRILAEQAAMEARAIPDGERKTITALFADIKGSMALLEHLDPEEARSLIDPALTLMMEAVHRYEGYVVQSTGDGIFAFFGAPIAHEDHPQRALYAALRMQEESRRFAETLRREKGVNFQIRVGLNTGEMVLRSIRKDDLRTDYTPVGHSTSLAARMESLATPGSIVVSEHTYKLTEGYFEFKALGEARVKGVSEPVRIYEVLGIGPLRTRLQVAARRGLVRFVGRQSEMEQLRRALEFAKGGHGQIVGVMGEPGVGKSRLFHEFKVLSHKGGLILETFSVSHGKAYPYLPLIDLLNTYFQIILQDDERKRQEKITGKVLTLDRSLEDTLPYLFFLLGIATPTSSLQQMDPQIRKQRTFEAIKRLLLRESLNQPLMIICEDLHWVDGETQAFLSLLSESVATARLLLLVNYRPEYHHEWGSKTFYTQLRLDPLGHEDAQQLLAALLGDDTALRPLKQFILEKTEGNPFFMEELVQALVEQGVLVRDAIGAHSFGLAPSTGHAPLPTDLRLPATVQGVLAARIDRLPTEAKALLQTLAVIGKEFSFGLLQQVVEKPAGELQGVLAHLQAGEFIYEQPAFPEVKYVFKHALTQEVAYNSVLQERRKEVHERVAQTIEALWPDQVEDRCSELAYHYRRSGNLPKAIAYLHRAGQQALRRSAYPEALDAVREALALLATQPDSPERARQELALQVTLGLSLRMAQGMSAEMEQAYARAQVLCERVGETAQLFSLLRGLHSVFLLKGDFPRMQEVAQRLVQIAQATANGALLVEAYFQLGFTAFVCGEFVQARGYYEQCLQRYEPEHYGSLGITSGVEVRAGSLSGLAFVLWYLGFPDQGQQCSTEALRWASQLSHLFSYTAALQLAADFRLACGDPQLSQELAEQAIRLATEQGLPNYVALGECDRGSALIEQGRAQEGIPSLRRGINAAKALGTRFLLPDYLTRLGQAYASLGQSEAAGAALSEALAERASMGEEHNWHDAELYRMRGEVTLQTAPAEDPLAQRHREAEAYFAQAIEIARQQQAKSWELRATLSLARLWRHQGKTTEAHHVLSEIYHWFTEGFDTKDLQEAKALLDELAEGYP
jgi:predicted ATPase/class 3 adenylate cyclase